jgi:hypothetical protein
MRVGNNTYIDSGATLRYKTTAAALLYGQNPTVGHFWSTAPSGTAGNAISFTQAMTLNASGNLGIGTTSPVAGYRLDVAGAVRLGTGSNLSWGETYNNNGPTIAGSFSAGFLAFYPSGAAGAERMRLDSAGNLGLGMAPSAWASNRSVLQLKGGTTAGGAYLVSGAAAQALLGTNAYSDGTVFRYLTATSATLYSQFLGDHSWSTAAAGTAGNAISFTQAMTLNASGDLLVGTTTNPRRFVASGSFSATNATTPFNNMVAKFENSNRTNGNLVSAMFAGTTSGGGELSLAGFAARVSSWTDAATNADLLFYTVGNSTITERMRLDSSGNLGLGVTPSAWGTTKALEFSYGSFSANSSLGTDVSGNCYYNGTNWIYRVTGVALRYNQATAGHSWHVASGTAGNAISFTQAMTLNASGNLLVGNTSSRPNSLFSVGGGINTDNGIIGYLTDDTFTLNGKTQPHYGFNLSPGSFGPSGISGFYGIAFATFGAERARIDSSGNLLVGRTSSFAFATSRLAVEHGQADYTQSIGNSHPTLPYGIAMRYTAASPNNTGSAYLYADDSSGTQRFSVRSNGGVYNFQGNNVNLSDRREKTNFAPAKSYLETICSIPVQTFNYIDQNNEEDPGFTLGVVAQDVQAVAPELVMESNWGTEDNPKQRLSIYQTDLQYALMKCIQEQQAIIQALTARVAALESN